MKQFLAGLLLIAFAAVASAVSVDEIIHLTKLKTSEKLIVQLIEKNGMERPVTTADVVRMKEQGVGENVIETALGVRKSGNIRTYTATDKKGKQIQVATNLDENGKRMGGPAGEKAPVFELPELPKEFVLTIRHEEPEQPPPPPQDEYYPYPEMYSGIPIYGTPAYPTYNFGGYPVYNPYLTTYRCTGCGSTHPNVILRNNMPVIQHHSFTPAPSSPKPMSSAFIPARRR